MGSRRDLGVGIGSGIREREEGTRFRKRDLGSRNREWE